MAQLTRLFLDQEELALFGRYSVRIDRTIVVEPVRQLTETTFKRLMDSRPVVHKVTIENPDIKPYIEYNGPYQFKKNHGLLIFSPIEA